MAICASGRPFATDFCHVPNKKTAPKVKRAPSWQGRLKRSPKPSPRYCVLDTPRRNFAIVLCHLQEYPKWGSHSVGPSQYAVHWVDSLPHAPGRPETVMSTQDWRSRCETAVPERQARSGTAFVIALPGVNGNRFDQEFNSGQNSVRRSGPLP